MLLSEMMIKRRLELDDGKKRKLKISESLMYLVFLKFLIVPPAMAIMITIPWEPTHALLKDLFEIDVKLQFSHIPFLVVVTWFAINIAGLLHHCKVWMSVFLACYPKMSTECQIILERFDTK